MKILKKINEIRHIIPDKDKVYVYGALGIILLIIAKICEKNNLIAWEISLLQTVMICIFFEFYFGIKCTIIDIKEYKKRDVKIKLTLIMAKLKAGNPLEPFEIKLVYKIIKRNKKDVLQKLKKENGKFKQK